ncbi:MAG: hypothetical protein NWQ31_08610 [Polaribacter sp.]|nr:hypothetical protein [Polaribacter sp.]
MNKNQIIGLLLAIIGVTLGLLWEKPEYADVLDFLFGVLTAIGLSMVLKFLPIKRKKKTDS